MRHCGRVSLVVLVFAVMPKAHAEIYTCTDEFGNVAYLQTPCPVEVAEETAATEEAHTPAVEADEFEYVPESSFEQQPVETSTPSSRRPGERLEVCKKRYRDKIDAIDAEISTSLTPTHADAYKEKLLELTRQLRACG